MAHIGETSISPLDLVVSTLGSELPHQAAHSLPMTSIPGHWLAALLQHSTTDSFDVLLESTTERHYRLFLGRKAIDLGLRLSSVLDSLLAQPSNLQAELPGLGMDEYLLHQQQLKRLA